MNYPTPDLLFCHAAWKDLNDKIVAVLDEQNPFRTVTYELEPDGKPWFQHGTLVKGMMFLAYPRRDRGALIPWEKFSDDYRLPA